MRAIQVLAGLLLAVVFATPASAATPGGVTQRQASGILQQAYVETFDRHAHEDTFAYALRGKHRTTPVVFESGDPTAMVGDRVELTGTDRDGTLHVRGARKGQDIRILDKAVSKGAWAAESTADGTTDGGDGVVEMSVGTSRKLAVILINFSDKRTEPWTKAHIANVARDDADGVKAFFEEEAKGSLTLNADVFGWYTIDATSTSCSTKWQNTYHDQAVAKATANGVNLDAYTNVMFMWPGLNDCGFAGVAYVNGKWSYINGTDSVQVLTHELGHNFGLGHANGYTCTSGGTEVMLAAPSSCEINYYADPFSTMGNNALRHNTGMGLVDMGLLAPDEKVVGEPGHTYTIKPYFGDAGLKLVRIPRGDGTYLDLDIRTPFGIFDTFGAADKVTTGVSIRVAVVTGVTGTPRQSRLLDATPTSAYGLADAALAVGRTMTDPVSTISVTVISAGSGGAVVRVREGIDPTSPRNLVANVTDDPSVVLSWGAATDNTAVGSYRVQRNGAQIATVDAGATSYTDTAVQAGTQYSYTVVAADTSGNLGPGVTATVTTNGTAPTPDPNASPSPDPTAGTEDTGTPTEPGNVVGVAGITSVDLSWDEATDDVAVTGYDITRNGVKIASTSSLSWKDTGRVPKTTYTYTVAARDTASHVGTAVQVVAKTLPDTIRPTTPKSFRKIARSGAYVTFDWSASSDNVRVVKYYVYRSGRSTPVKSTTNSSIKMYTVRGAYYYVRAVDSSGNRSYASAKVKGRR